MAVLGRRTERRRKPKIADATLEPAPRRASYGRRIAIGGFDAATFLGDDGERADGTALGSDAPPRRLGGCVPHRNRERRFDHRLLSGPRDGGPAGELFGPRGARPLPDA